MFIKACSIGQPLDLYEDGSTRNGNAADKPCQQEKQGELQVFL